MLQVYDRVLPSHSVPTMIGFAVLAAAMFTFQGILDAVRGPVLVPPVGPRLHQLALHTIGQVMTPGETLMLIVPDHEALSVEARVSPNDIDQLRPGQPVALRFSAFNMRTTPEVNGTVSWISPDVTKDEHTGVS